MILASKIEQVSHSDYYQLIRQELEGNYNMQLMLIKGHLLIEHAINKAIEKLAKHKPKVKFTFFEKLALVQMLGLFNAGENGRLIFDAIVTLNEARNKFAHKLEIDDKQLFNDLFSKHPEFIERLKTIDKEIHSIPDNLKLYVTIMFICVNLFNGLDAMIEINNAYAEVTTSEFKKRLDERLWSRKNYWFTTPFGGFETSFEK